MHEPWVMRCENIDLGRECILSAQEYLASCARTFLQIAALENLAVE